MYKKNAISTLAHTASQDLNNLQHLILILSQQFSDYYQFASFPLRYLEFLSSMGCQQSQKILYQIYNTMNLLGSLHNIWQGLDISPVQYIHMGERKPIYTCGAVLVN